MKTYLKSGALIALGYAAVTLALYFGGLHSDPAKFTTATHVSFFTNFVISTFLMIKAVRVRRVLTPPTYEFPFGLAMGIAVFVSVSGTLLSSIFQFLYMAFLNPGFAGTAVQSGMFELQTGGASPERLQKYQESLQILYQPAIYSFAGLILGTVLNVAVASVLGLVLRRKAVEE